MQNRRDKLIIMGCGLAFFGVGIAALQLDRACGRTGLLTLAFAGLLAIAGYQTWLRIKERK